MSHTPSVRCQRILDYLRRREEAESPLGWKDVYHVAWIVVYRSALRRSVTLDAALVEFSKTKYSRKIERARAARADYLAQMDFDRKPVSSSWGSSAGAERKAKPARANG